MSVNHPDNQAETGCARMLMSWTRGARDNRKKFRVVAEDAAELLKMVRQVSHHSDEVSSIDL